MLPTSILHRIPRSYRRVIDNNDPNTQCQMIIDDDTLWLKSFLVSDFYKPYYEIETSMGISDWAQRRMILDAQTTMMDDMLCQVDRASMGSSLEVRSPLLSYELAEYSYKLPMEYKYRKGESKRILRNIAYKYIPKDMLNIPKRGFSVPIGEWMRKSLKEMLLSYSDADLLRRQGFFYPQGVRNMIEDVFLGSTEWVLACWRFLVFQLWLERYERV